MIDLWMTICLAFGLGNCGTLQNDVQAQPAAPSQPPVTSKPLSQQPGVTTNSGRQDECIPNEEETRMLDLVNQARASARFCGSQHYASAPALTWNCKLRDAARSHSRDMADINFFSHTGSDGLRVSDRVSAQGYVWSRVGENIAAGQNTAEIAMEGWLSSPGHCANLMGRDYNDFGSAGVYSEQSDFGTYWAQVFGTKLELR